MQWVEKSDYPVIRSFTPATMEDILTVHDSSLYKLVEATESHGQIFFSGDTSSNHHTFKASIYAAGAALYALDKSTTEKQIFSLIRPPGHHANKYKAMGFCYFNNAAIAAEIAIREKYQRIAIVDFDNHYGNGTADIFEDRSDILYISSHADPSYCFPGSGFLNEIGRDKGKGFNIPVPLPPRCNDNDIVMLYETIVAPIIRQFKPELLIVSAGFDGYVNDPVGILGFTENGFAYFGDFVARLADELGIPVLSTLEGGYNVDKLPHLLAAYLSGFDPRLGKFKSLKKNKPSNSTMKLADYLKKVHEPYWHLN
jgi:acetoin utilization deacetylase AcuC-like enzyme